MTDLRKKFVEKAKELKHPRMIVAVTKIPNGALEVITSQELVPEKIEFYLTAYDDNFKHVMNKDVEVVDFILI